MILTEGIYTGIRIIVIEGPKVVWVSWRMISVCDEITNWLELWSKHQVSSITNHLPTTVNCNSHFSDKIFY
jgi:hypothetical protein